MKSVVAVRCTHGALLSPAEVREQTEKDLGWALAGILDPKTYRAFKSGATGSCRHLSWAPSSFGKEFLLVTHQVGQFQHRFLVSACDANTHLWVRTLKDARFRCLFTEDDEGRPPHLGLSDMLEEAGTKMFEGIRQVDTADEARAHLARMEAVLPTAMFPHAMPSLFPGVTVRSIVLSIVHPDRIVAAAFQ